jgi:plastocyanin
MKKLSTLIAVGMAAALASGAAAAPRSGTIVIRHQVRGCHAWSFNGGAYGATLKVKLARGGTLTIVDNDVMAHQLVQTSGPGASIQKLPSTMMEMSHEFTGPGVMAHMGASIKVTFAKAGTYRFTTKAGEDYMKGMKTVGEDNVLRLTVTVS